MGIPAVKQEQIDADHKGQRGRYAKHGGILTPLNKKEVIWIARILEKGNERKRSCNSALCR